MTSGHLVALLSNLRRLVAVRETVALSDGLLLNRRYSVQRKIGLRRAGTAKSHHEALDAWAIRELVGHYVAYRKLVSPSPSDLLPEKAVSAIRRGRALPS